MTSSSPASSPRVSKKSRISTVKTKGMGKAVETDDMAGEAGADELWVDKYAPQDRVRSFQIFLSHWLKM